MDTSERRKRASTEAAGWFARLQAGEMERSERQQFVEWLRESYIHVTEMLRVAQIHGELEQFQQWAHVSTGPKTDDDNILLLPVPLDEDSQESRSHSSSPPASRRRPERVQSVRLFGTAAAVLIVIAALVLPKVRGQVIETERGERREVVLSDGSILQVDPETRLRVKYADEVRQVFLERGRALFHVTKNANRPFLVRADDTTVRAVGTAFGVEEQSNGITVTVAEGKVAVSSKGFQPPSASRAEVSQELSASIPLQQSEREGPAKRRGRDGSFSSGRETPGGLAGEIGVPESIRSRPGAVFLTADQQVTIPSSGAAEPVRHIDSHRALAWAEGRLIFQNDELGKVVAEFNRYNRVQLTVANPTLAGEPVSGVFNAADPEAFIAFLQSVTAVQIVRDGDRSITIGTAR